MSAAAPEPCRASVHAMSSLASVSPAVAEPADLDLVAQRLGRRVSELRALRRRTLDELAGEVGFTKGYLSKIENGRQVPPIGTLLKLAQALGTDIADLLEGGAQLEARQEVCIVRADQRQSVRRAEGAAQPFDYGYAVLAQAKRHKRMEPFVMTMTEAVGRSLAEHDGEEFLYVLSGEVEWEMEIDGRLRTWVLSKGDSCYFDSRLPHRGRSVKGESEVLLVIYRPDAPSEAADNTLRPRPSAR
jgi:transcriptional regulator with XRE-family HTH domain